MLLLFLHIGLSVVVTATASGQELVANGGFESALSKQQWLCHACSMTTESTDSHGGHSALKVTSRRQTFSGPGQKVHVRRGTRYRVQAYVKQLNDVSSSLFQKHMLRFTYRYSSRHEARRVAQRTMIRSVDGWFSMVGFIMVPNATISSAELRHVGPGSGISYLLDDVSITEIAEDRDWRTHSDQQIDAIRKGDIHIRFHLPSSIHPADISVQIDQKKHHFSFGTLVKDDYMLDASYKRYQDIVYSLFNMATLQSFKWKFDKGSQYDPDYSRAVSAMHTLRAHGLKVRGHNMFWGFTKNMPMWVPRQSMRLLNASVESRLHYMVNITKGQLVHWDVMNELLHGHWFEERFHDPLYTQRIFRQVKALDPHPTLMLNDFQVCSLPDVTDAYLQQAKQYLANGVPLEALGIQSHFKESEPDPTVIKARLDHVAQSGLPLWVTEMSFMEADPQRKADLYERAYRLYFSHPAVHGIVIWGFWDQQGQMPQSALVDGFNYKFNEAGIRVARLLQEEWSTHVTRTLTSGATNVDVRGFKGDYDVIVRVKGVPVKVKSFSLKGSDVTVSITLSGHEGSVTLPPPVSTLVPPSGGGEGGGSTPTDSNTNDHSLGAATSSASSSSLHCVSRWSPLSQPGGEQHVQVSCVGREVMTGCSSLLKNHDWRKDGERIEVVHGQSACVAIDGYRSTGGVQAVAVCCKASGLSCTYRVAGPSPAGSDVTVHTTCPHPQIPLGCSAWNTHSGVGGVQPSSNTCVASNLDPVAGVYVYGSCCTAPRLSCVTVTSSPSGLGQGDAATVSCDASHVMTSCHAQAPYGKSSGAYITGLAHTVCHAYNGVQLTQGQSGVKAVAICCRVIEDDLIGK